MSAGASDDGAERPRAQRVRARIEAAYEDPVRQVFLPTLDLSESGVFLVSAEAPAIGAQAQVVLELPGHEAFLRLRGTVTRAQTDPVAGFGIRFEIDEASEEALAALRAFVGREVQPE